MRVLVPIEILEGDALSPGLIDLLEPLEVVLLGFHELPDQTPPDQARLQYEERATDALDDIAEGFDGEVETKLVFTNDREKTMDRMAEELTVDAYVIRGATGDVENLLVSLSGQTDADRVGSFVRTLVDGRTIGVTLVVAGEDAATRKEVLESVADSLEQSGIDVETRVLPDSSPLDALVESIPRHDAVVMGEMAPSLSSFVLGDPEERVAAETVGPVLVVRDT